MTLDIQIFYSLNNLIGQSAFLDTLIDFVANEFAFIVIILAFLSLLFLKGDTISGAHYSFSNIWRRIKIFCLLFFSGCFAWVLAQVIKMTIAKARPFIAFSDVRILFEHGGYDSFPSGHATFFAALATALYFYNKKVGTLFALFALAIGMARISAGVHFPVDILAGYVLGIVSTIIVVSLYRHIKKKFSHISWLEILPHLGDR